MAHPDFTPDLNQISNRGSFRFWCQKVLPLVYDDSLSYYELLCKVIEYLNNTMNDVRIMGGNIDALKEAYTEFQNYIFTEFDAFTAESEEKYNQFTTNITNEFNDLKTFIDTFFDELDLSEEVSDKLDEMAASGALTNLLSPLIPNLVTTWLNDNVTPVGSAVVVDNSLTIQGAAADSAVVGQNISDLRGAVNANYSSLKDAFITNNLARFCEYVDGYLDLSGNALNPSPGYITSDFISTEGNSGKVYLSKALRIGFYGSNKTSLASCVSPSPNTDVIQAIGNNVKYIRYTIAKADQYNLVVSMTDTAPSAITYDLKNSPAQNDIKQTADSAFDSASKSARHLWDYLAFAQKCNTGIVDISNLVAFEDGKVIISTGVADNPDWTTSDYLKINQLTGCEIFYAGAITTSAFPVAIFDANKSFIAALPTVANNEKFKIIKIDAIISSYANAKYIKISNERNGDKVYLEYKPADVDAKVVNGFALSGTNTESLTDLLLRKWEFTTENETIISTNPLFLSTPMLPVANVLGTITYNGYFASTSAFPVACFDITRTFIKALGVGDGRQNVNVDIKAAYKEDPRIAYVRIYENSSQANGISITYTRGGEAPGESGIASVASQQDYAELGYERLAQVEFDYNIFICYGQSFSQGAGTVTESEYGAPNCYMLGDYPNLTDASASAIPSATLKRVFRTGSPTALLGRPPVMYAMTSFSYRYSRYKDANRNYIIISVGEGDRTVARLMDPERYVDVSTGAYYFPYLTGAIYYRDYLLAALQRVKEIADSENKTCGVISVFFANGEADYGNDSQVAETTTAKCSCNGNGQEWANRVLQLKSDMETDISTIFGQAFPPAWFISQCCGSYGGPTQSIDDGKWVRPSFGINQAQSVILPEHYGIFSVSPDYQLPNVTDGHLTGNGWRWWGEYIAEAFESVLIRYERPFTLRVKDARLLDSKTIGVSFYIPVAPLQFDTYTCHAMINKGFAVFVDGVSVQIDDVSIIDNSVYITLHNAIQAGEVVRLDYATYYSYGTDGFAASCAGNLCDSSMTGSYLLGVEDLPRYKNGVEIPVEYIPVDKDGHTLVGKPFPLKNWCVAFSKTLT